jgi:hypothetical protein
MGNATGASRHGRTSGDEPPRAHKHWRHAVVRRFAAL